VSSACRDITGHRSLLTVGLTGDQHVTLTLPGGTTAILTPEETGRLRRSLAAAAIEASVGGTLIEHALARYDRRAAA
jgi:hypothetical protein